MSPKDKVCRENLAEEAQNGLAKKPIKQNQNGPGMPTRKHKRHRSHQEMEKRKPSKYTGLLRRKVYERAQQDWVGQQK